MKNVLRRLVRAYVAAQLRRRSNPLVLADSEPILVIAPHPDDESFGCGALLARRAANGSKTDIAYFTNGEGSHPGHPILGPHNIGALRLSEAKRAMASIGIKEEHLHFCGAPDGRLNALSQAEVLKWTARLLKLISETGPSVVLLPCRDDGSSEHEAMFLLLRKALGEPGAPAPRVLEFPVWSWWSPRLLARVAARRANVWRQPAGEFSESKRILIESYPSQSKKTPPFSKPVLPARFTQAFDVEEEFFLESPLSP